MAVFENRIDLSPEQDRFFSMEGLRILEQTRSGAVIFCDMLNPDRPLLVITLTGNIELLRSYYNLEA